MGQRTQMLLVKEDNNGQRQAQFYHCQWGYGRIMYLTVMDILITDYCKHTIKPGYSLFSAIRPQSTSEEWSDMGILQEIPQQLLDDANPYDFGTVADIFRNGDNNNGGIVIYVKEHPERPLLSEIKIGFLLGPEDTRSPFAKYVSPETYGKFNGGSQYSDENFVKIFLDFCDYFNITFLHDQPSLS